MIAYIILGIVVLVLLLVTLRGIFLIGANEVGILSKRMFGAKMPEGQIVARNGEIGVQAQILMPGLYWRMPYVWSWKKVPVISIDDESIAIVESIDGEPLPKGRILGDEVECNQYQDPRAFLNNHGKKGPQVGILRPGTYRINTDLFQVTINPATIISENKIGVAVALDGKPLPSGYIIAPEPKSEKDHRFYQDGQVFIEMEGYRGPQLSTLQPGKYYINPLLFGIGTYDVAEVPPGYVAVLRSNVGLELVRDTTTPRVAGHSTELTTTAVHEDVENILISNREMRGIWREPVAPGKYNLNPIAFTPYLVPTSAVTIDWAASAEARGDTRVANTKTELEVTTKAEEFFKFTQLKVTSQDGFQLDVDVRMVIRIKPENAAFVIARFGSVPNLIQQIVHPLIDSSFRNKAGEKKALDFVQSRTDLQKEALERASTEFERYLVEAQNLLIAYINVDKSLLETQTKREIAVQQQTQYEQEAAAQNERIAVMEKSARADKQKDVIDAKLSVDINTDKAEARIRESQGIKQSNIIQAEGNKQSTILQADGNAYKSRAEGQGIADAYNAQKEAIGQANVAFIKLIQEIAAGKIKVVPDVLVSGSEGNTGNLINAFLAKMISQQGSDNSKTESTS